MSDILPLKWAHQKAMEGMLNPSEENKQAFRETLQKMGIPEEEIEETLAGLGQVRKGYVLGGAHSEDIAKVADRAFSQGVTSVTLRITREEDGHLCVEVLETEGRP